MDKDHVLEMTDMTAKRNNESGGTGNRREKRRNKNRGDGENNQNTQAIRGLQRALAEKDVNNHYDLTPSNAADF